MATTSGPSYQPVMPQYLRKPGKRNHLKKKKQVTDKLNREKIGKGHRSSRSTMDLSHRFTT